MFSMTHRSSTNSHAPSDNFLPAHPATPWRESHIPILDQTDSWPAEARAAMEAYDNKFPKFVERRALPRRRHRVVAQLQLGGETRTIYLRDLNIFAAGFIAPGMVPSVRNATLTFTNPGGKQVTLACRVRRCRAFDECWCEGAVEFSPIC